MIIPVALCARCSAPTYWLTWPAQDNQIRTDAGHIICSDCDPVLQALRGRPIYGEGT